MGGRPGVWAPVLFTGMMILQVIVAVIPGEPLEIAAGYAFGAVEGTFLCILGTFIGGMLVFLLVRRFGLRAVEVFFPAEKLRSSASCKTSGGWPCGYFSSFSCPAPLRMSCAIS